MTYRVNLDDRPQDYRDVIAEAVRLLLAADISALTGDDLARVIEARSLLAATRAHGPAAVLASGGLRYLPATQPEAPRG